jgi:beta-glucosidase
MRLPDNQIDLLKRIRETGKSVIALLFAGAPVEMQWEKDADAIFAMYTAGQAMPSALLKLVFGAANPCGKLAETFPLRPNHTPAALNYPQPVEADYQEGIFVGYRYYDKKEMDVAYPFGYGLSYTTWEYSNLTLDTESMTDNDSVTVSVDVTNTGAVSGKEIVQLYVGAVDSPVVRPVRELKGFMKVSCAPGETKTVTFLLNKRSFAYYNTEISNWHVTSGRYVISVGTSSRELLLSRVVSVESTVKIPKVYDEFITVDELGKTTVGQQFLANMMGQMMAGMPEGPTPEEKARLLEDEDNIVDVSMDYAAMGNDMPLIKVADMTAGAFPHEAVYQLVATLNQVESEENE